VYEIGVVVQFEAAHQLRGEFGPATRVHGHTYRVEITARGPSLQPDGSLFDLGLLDQEAQTVASALNYRNLDEVAAFSGRNSTAEVVARHFYDEIAPRIQGKGLSSLAIRLWESPRVFAGYAGNLD
jgi:6-pyruvoyltetrahydropterin/6-carboxytetrahydropterin synthase